MPSAFFRVLGTVLSVAEILLWIVVSCGTIWKAWTGEIFFAPCLGDLDGDGRLSRKWKRRRKLQAHAGNESKQS